ncbi:MAG: cupredoxin domain-containing protein [Thaumarchaeota archaeon]|nr:cupredoxin domain-containing protein [Nitrososphaerota archaeon]MBI3641177.1 cupredoxin domain-containing protein [Nitrososphaerota archaeon]
MRRKQKNNNKNKFFTRGTIIGIAVIAVAASVGGYFALGTMIPVNGTTPIFAPPSNIYILAIHTDQDGYVFEEQSTRQGKKTLSSGAIDVSIHMIRGELVALHVINEDKDTLSPMDLNIDEFNVHTKTLNYFQAQTINFVADKTGTFKYYSTIHPEMKGTIIVEEG